MSKKYAKHKIWTVLLVLALGAVLALSGCGGSGEGAKPEAGKTPSGAGEGVQDTLIYGRGGDSVALDPAIVTESESLKIGMQVFDTLLEYKGKHNGINRDLQRAGKYHRMDWSIRSSCARV